MTNPTTTTNETESTIAIADFGTGPVTSGEGWSASLYLDPEERKVSLHTQYGTGTPRPVGNRRALLITVPARADSEALQEAVEALRGSLEDLMDLYEGTVWDGNNNRGSWAGKDGVPAYQWADAIEQELESVPQYWDADSWLEGAWSESRREVEQALIEGSDLDALAEEWTCSACCNGALVDQDEVRKCISTMVEQLHDAEAQEEETLFAVDLADYSSERADEAVVDAADLGETWALVEARGPVGAAQAARSLAGVAARRAEARRLLVDVWDGFETLQEKLASVLPA